ncbi:hypothetical protein HHK36_007174 [Tetracentron sinense]|uniref:Uncharacterized protein n=1 Tax=Tetracentron sinense TaxID=13715 RepID=A0A835DPQ7_TETSI|nr:hypothetical protein HHK36_007174 [Tetracentron sinense]
MDVGDEERIGFSGGQVGDEVRMTFSGREVGDEVRTVISGGEVGDEVRTAFSGEEHIDIWMELLAQRHARHPDLYAQSCVFVPTWFMIDVNKFRKRIAYEMMDGIAKPY